MCPGVRPEGWLRCFTHSFGDVECSGHAQYPILASDRFCSRFFRNGSWVFGLLVSLVQNLSQLHMHAVIFSPIVSPYCVT